MSAVIIKIKSKPGIGYNVSHSERKTKRTYLINKQKFCFVSKVLGKKIILKCSCRIRRTILKYGDIDRYFLFNRKVMADLLSLKKEFNKRIISSKSC